jgi:hypothetical protein
MSKVLAWSSLATVILFAIVASVGVLSWESLGVATARNLILGSIFLLVTSILLAASILVLESLSGGGPTETAAVSPTEAKTTTPLFPDFPAAEEPAEELAAAAEPPAETMADSDDDDF